MNIMGYKQVTDLMSSAEKSFDCEPLDFDAAVFLGVGTGGFFPATAYGFEADRIDLEVFDQDATDFTGTVFRKFHGFERHLADEGVAALFAEFIDEGVVHVAAKEDRGS